MVTLQEYKAKKAEATALSDVDFRKAQLLERNPRTTESNTSMVHYNPITKRPYFTEGVVVNPRYDVKPLDMLSRQLNNEAIEATTWQNPIQRDTNVSEGLARQGEYRTHYLNSDSPSCAVSKIGLLKPEKLRKPYEMENFIHWHKNEDIILDYTKYLKPAQDDSYLRLQLTLGAMDAEDGKLHEYHFDQTRQSMVDLIEAYKTAGLPVASIQTPEGLELALAAIEAQKPQEKIFSYLTGIMREANRNKIDDNPFLEENIINSYSFKDREILNMIQDQKKIEKYFQ